MSLVAESLRFIGQSKAISDRKLREQIQCAQRKVMRGCLGWIENRSHTLSAKRCACLNRLGRPSENAVRLSSEMLDKPGIRSQCFNLTDGSRLRVELSF